MDDVQLSPCDHLVQGRAPDTERSRRLNDGQEQRLFLTRPGSLCADDGSGYQADNAVLG
jgi:hypothetical protein